MAPGLVGAGITQLSLAVDTVIGTYLPAKSVSFMYYADRINQLPLGVLGIAVGTALLPTLSRQVSAGENDRALASLNRAIEYAMLLTLPAAAALLIIADPILQVLFVGGKFTHADADSQRAIIGRLRRRIAGFRADQGVGAWILRAWRHVDAGANRHGHIVFECGAEPCPDEPAETCRARRWRRRLP